jgi:hypothetical protein
MNRNGTDAAVREIMQDYARLTGLSPVGANPKRYLWTDAFAVCNYLELFRQTNDESFRDLGLRLIHQVHHTLGRHRIDDPRSGWISGLDEQEGEQHPTRGGLRIGKRLNERKAEERPDERLEWDQDGQYYHYLTKWMHALNRAGQVAGDMTYIRWAIELAKTAHARFTYISPSGGRKRMYWKMSIDLTRPLVLSMGQHDPLDGFVTYSELQAAAARYFGEMRHLDLDSEIAEMAEICREIRLTTDDPLGIGSLLFDGSRIIQLMIQDSSRDGNISRRPGLASLLENVLNSALIGVASFANGEILAYPADYRLAFRELGLSIGLSAVKNMKKWIEENPSIFPRESRLHVEDLTGYMPLRDRIEQSWMNDRNREARTWIEHREINMVMLATSLYPDSFLMI